MNWSELQTGSRCASTWNITLCIRFDVGWSTSGGKEQIRRARFGDFRQPLPSLTHLLFSTSSFHPSVFSPVPSTFICVQLVYIGLCPIVYI